MNRYIRVPSRSTSLGNLRNYCFREGICSKILRENLILIHVLYVLRSIRMMNRCFSWIVEGNTIFILSVWNFGWRKTLLALFVGDRFLRWISNFWKIVIWIVLCFREVLDLQVLILMEIIIIYLTFKIRLLKIIIVIIIMVKMRIEIKILRIKTKKINNSKPHRNNNKMKLWFQVYEIIKNLTVFLKISYNASNYNNYFFIMYTFLYL